MRKSKFSFSNKDILKSNNNISNETFDKFSKNWIENRKTKEESIQLDSSIVVALNRFNTTDLEFIEEKEKAHIKQVEEEKEFRQTYSKDYICRKLDEIQLIHPKFVGVEVFMDYTNRIDRARVFDREFRIKTSQITGIRLEPNATGKRIRTIDYLKLLNLVCIRTILPTNIVKETGEVLTVNRAYDYYIHQDYDAVKLPFPNRLYRTMFLFSYNKISRIQKILGLFGCNIELFISSD